MKRTLAAAVLTAGALALTACGSSGSSSNTGGNSSSTGSGTQSSAPAATGGSIIFGSADFGENEVLAAIYADALSAKGVKASTHLDIGERDAAMIGRHVEGPEELLDLEARRVG